MPYLLKIRKYITKYVVEQLSEHFEKQNAVIFRRVILVGKLTFKKVFVLCIQGVQREVMFLHVWKCLFCDVEYRFKSF